METASVHPRSRWSLAVLVLANMVPLAGALFGGWDVRLLVLLYWAENLIIGGYNILRMALVSTRNPSEAFSKLFFIPFFSIHYGMFCLAHGLFILLFFYGGSETQGLPFGPRLLLRAWQLSDGLLLWPLIGLVISHGVSLIEHFFLQGERRRVTLKQLMAAPYGRIVILHVAILAGGIFVQKWGSPWPLLVVLVLLKTGLDVVLHRRSHSAPSTPARMEA